MEIPISEEAFERFRRANEEHFKQPFNREETLEMLTRVRTFYRVMNQGFAEHMRQELNCTCKDCTKYHMLKAKNEKKCEEEGQ